MKKNLYFVFIAASFALLAAAPGRLAYGLPLIIELNLLVSGAAAFNILAKKMELDALQEILSLAFIVFLAALYKQALVLFSPVLALVLGFAIYLPAASAYLLGNVFSSPAPSIPELAKSAAHFSAFAFLFFLLRDILGYGTISVPTRNGIKEAVLFNVNSASPLSFFATIPGAILTLTLCMALLLAAQSRFNALEKSEAADEND